MSTRKHPQRSILLVTQTYYPLIGGIETHVHQIAQEFQQEGHRVAIAAMNFAAYQGHPRYRVLQTSLMATTFADSTDGTVPVYSLAPRGASDRLALSPLLFRTLPVRSDDGYHQLHRLGHKIYHAHVAPRLSRLMEEVDVVHALAGDYIGWTTQALAQQKGIPCVCTPFVHPHQWGDGPEDVAYYKRCDAVIGLVSTDTAYVQSLGIPAEKFHTIGVSPDLPAHVDGQAFRARHGLGEKPVVLYVGRMMAQKGARAVVEAAPIVWEKSPETQFLFIGPGSPSEVAIFDGSDPRLRYLGKVSAQEKGDALAACDVFCMPSMSEILPTVYLEAWSLGKPVVGGQAHGLPELVEGNGGGFNAAQTGDAVAEALVHLLLDSELRQSCGTRGKALVAQKYATAAVAKQLLELYGELIDRKEKMLGK